MCEKESAAPSVRCFRRGTFRRRARGGRRREDVGQNLTRGVGGLFKEVGKRRFRQRGRGVEPSKGEATRNGSDGEEPSSEAGRQAARGWRGEATPRLQPELYGPVLPGRSPVTASGSTGSGRGNRFPGSRRAYRQAAVDPKAWPWLRRKPAPPGTGRHTFADPAPAGGPR